MEDIKSQFHQEWWITQGILTRRQFIYTVNWARNHDSIAEAGLEIVRKVYTLVQKEDKHFLYNGECTTSWENKSSEVITDTKKSRKVNHQIHWRLEQNAKDWIYLSAMQKQILAVQAIIMHKSSLEECVVEVVKENKEENCSQDNLRLERTRCNTPRYLRAQEFRRFKHRPGTLTQFHQRVAMGRTRILKHGAWPSQRHHSVTEDEEDVHIYICRFLIASK